MSSVTELAPRRSAYACLPTDIPGLTSQDQIQAHCIFDTLNRNPNGLSREALRCHMGPGYEGLPILDRVLSVLVVAEILSCEDERYRAV